MGNFVSGFIKNNSVENTTISNTPPSEKQHTTQYHESYGTYGFISFDDLEKSISKLGEIFKPDVESFLTKRRLGEINISLPRLRAFAKKYKTALDSMAFVHTRPY